MKTADFIAALNSDNLKKPGVQVVGLTRSSGKEDEIMFSPGHSCINWLAIPEKLIAQVQVLDEVRCGDHRHPLVEITLKPSTAEGKVLADLLEIIAAETHIRHLTSVSMLEAKLSRSLSKIAAAAPFCPDGQFAVKHPETGQWTCVPL